MKAPAPVTQYLLSTFVTKEGDVVRAFYTTDRPSDDCEFCKRGICRQRVEQCAAWECDVVIHGERLPC